MLSKLISLIAPLAPILNYLWRLLTRPVMLPIWLLLLAIALCYWQVRAYQQTIQNAFDYQDSVLKAQDTELYQLRGDTLEAHYEIRQLYYKLNDREKQEVIYYEQLHLADDANLQRGLDSVYNKTANSAKLVSARIGQPAPAGQSGYRAYDSTFINDQRGRRTAGVTRSLSR